MADLSFSSADIDMLSTMPLSAIEAGRFVEHVPRLGGGRSEVEDKLPYDLSKHEQVSSFAVWLKQLAESVL
jgi:anaerobic glycerol-3-phosphate dehydrogenase